MLTGDLSSKLESSSSTANDENRLGSLDGLLELQESLLDARNVGIGLE